MVKIIKNLSKVSFKMDLMLAPLQDLLKFLKGNKTENFQFVMIICFCLGIHPEILFEFMPYVQMSFVYVNKLKMISLGGFFYRKLLSSPGFMSPSRQRDLLNLRFKKVMLAKILEQFGCQLLPLIFPRPSSQDVSMFQCASALSFLRHSGMQVDHIFFRRSYELLMIENALLLQTMLLNLHHQFPDVVLFFREHPVQLKNFLEFWKGNVVFFLFHDADREKAKQRRTNMDFFAILIIVSLFDPTFLQQKLDQLLFCGNLDLERCFFTPQQSRLFLELFSLFNELSSEFNIQKIFFGKLDFGKLYYEKLNLKYLLQSLQSISLDLYQEYDLDTKRQYAAKKDYKKRNHNGLKGYSGQFMHDSRKYSLLFKSFGQITENLIQDPLCSYTETIFAKFSGMIGLVFSQFQNQMKLNLRRYPDVYISVEFQKNFRRFYYDFGCFRSVSHWAESPNLSDIDFLRSTERSDLNLTKILSSLEQNEQVSINSPTKSCCKCSKCTCRCHYNIFRNTCADGFSCCFCLKYLQEN
jgi:hypothetical protein